MKKVSPLRIARTLGLATLALSGALSFSAAHAQSTYPNKPIKFVVPFSAGTTTDVIARIYADKLGKILGQNVIVDNKAGAGGTVGSSYVSRANPDGYTVLLMHVGFTTAPSLYKKPNYNAIDGFEPIGLVVDVPMTIVARSDFPANNIKELVEYVKKNKDKVSLANAGIGAASHLCGVMFASGVGVDLLTVPYKGTGPAMNDLVGKQVDLLCDQTTNTTQQIKANTIKAYAVTSKERVATLPDLPTMDESGFKGFEVGIWHGMWVPKNTPAPIRAKLLEALQAGLADPKFQERMAGLGAQVLTKDANPAALDAKVKQQVPQWAELFKKAGVEAQ